MADALTQILEISQNLEKLLKTKFGAEGDGLISEYQSIKDKLPALVARKIDKHIYDLADMRNKATHEDVALAEKFLGRAQQAFQAINKALTSTSATPQSNEEQALQMEAKLEQILVDRFYASGSTLHTKYSSAERHIDRDTQAKVGKKIRFIATVCNWISKDGKRIDAKKLHAIAANYDEAFRILEKAQPLLYAAKSPKFSKSREKKGAKADSTSAYAGPKVSSQKYQTFGGASSFPKTSPKKQSFQSSASYRSRPSRADEGSSTYEHLVYVIGGLIVVILILALSMMFSSLKTDEPQAASDAQTTSVTSPASDSSSKLDAVEGVFSGIEVDK